MDIWALICSLKHFKQFHVLELLNVIFFYTECNFFSVLEIFTYPNAQTLTIDASFNVIMPFNLAK